MYVSIISLFDGEFYKQIDRAAMGSPLGPTSANIFLCFHEKIWLDKCRVEFKPVIYTRFVDDTFLLYRSKEHIGKFGLYLNCQHPNIKFTSEIEENNSISFLDIKINRDNNRFLTSVYRKPTFSGVFTNFDSFIPLSYKSGLISSLLYKAFKLCSNFEIFLQEMIFYLFKRNGYLSNFIDKCENFRREKSIFVSTKEGISLCLTFYW